MDATPNTQLKDLTKDCDGHRCQRHLGLEYRGYTALQLKRIVKVECLGFEVSLVLEDMSAFTRKGGRRQIKLGEMFSLFV